MVINGGFVTKRFLRAKDPKDPGQGRARCTHKTPPPFDCGVGKRQGTLDQSSKEAVEVSK